MAEMHQPSQLDTRACRDAIALAERVLIGQVPEDGPFTLIGCANLIKGARPPSGLSVWELTFKASALIPPTASEPVGAGGEWIVRVDLARADNPVSAVRGD